MRIAKRLMRWTVQTVPGLRHLDDLYWELHRNRRTLAEWARFVPPGHFHSPVPDLDEVREREAALFDRDTDLPAIELNIDAQLGLLESFGRFHPDLPWQGTPRPGLRYYYENDFFSYGDGVILSCFMRHFQPNRIIEIGSGFSSCVMLDTNERFLNGATSLMFVEPHPHDRLLRLLRKSDEQSADVRTCRFQDLPLEELSALGLDDILFVDSSHVSKVGSDVNWLFFRVIPQLAPGVLIHVHDIFYPFEYPRQWIFDGRAWNEAYLLHAFLMSNRTVRIEYWCDFIGRFHRDRLAGHLPLCLRNTGGSIWLRRI